MLLTLIVLLSQPGWVYACGGKDVILSEDPALVVQNDRFDDQGNLLIQKSKANISPALAQAIVTGFLKKAMSDPPLPLTFRKLEKVHGKLIYQFQSQPLSDYNGKYHLGPVNFIVDRLVLDVDAATGNLYLANGCGAAPGQLLYKYNPSDFKAMTTSIQPTLISNNTNFIARRTGNSIKIDGRIGPEEWKNTGHKYFYLGTYKPHAPSQPHRKAYYYAEVWSQIDDGNIYFAVKTDTPYWVALMFKDEPNLGMLGSYRDAKVMKSNGEISDRYFTQRKDKSFYLAFDKKDHILSKGSYQGDFYTYEFAFPLKSNDPEDVAFEEGKAYNMLLLVGNTLDHYGIFTLNKAHANHDHSRNNKEHTDVWASNEETIRIGSPADRDIYGNPVRPVLASYVSGFDPAKDNNHFHYAGASIQDFNKRASKTRFISWLSVILSLFGAGIIMIRFRSSPPDRIKQAAGGRDLLKIKWFRRLVTYKYFRYIFIIPTLAVFLLIIYLGFFDIQDGRRNIATVFTWTLWWSLLIFSFIIAGRLWCMMCPFAALGDLSQKFISLNRKLPRRLQNMGFQTLAFVLLTWAFAITAFSSKPVITAVVIVSILIAAVIFSMIYQRRSFCRHICPIGAVIGIYSMVSPIELRAAKEDRCTAHGEKTCRDACPMLESPYQMDNNVYCNFCMKCQPACPSRNLSLRLRTFGKDIYDSLHKSCSEALASLFLLGVVIVETLAMTSSWRPLKATLGIWTGISSPALLYSIIFFFVVLLPVGIFYLICYILKLWLGKEQFRTQGLFTEFAFLFIPMGIALHLAHNIQHLFIEGPIVVPATVRFLQGIGIGTSLFLNWNPPPLLGLEPIFFIQMSIIVGGLGFTMFVMYRKLRRFRWPLKQAYKTVVVMSLYALIVVLTSIYMLGLPMSARHVH